MKYLIFTICLFRMLIASFAQSPTPPPLPSGALLANPEFAQWQVTIADQTKQAPAPSSGESSGQAASAKAVSAKAATQTIIRVTKTKNIRYQEIVDPSTGKVTIWCEDNLQVMMTPGEPMPTLYSAPDPTNPYYVSYTKSPFPECAWVSAKNYTGIQKINGRDCIVFGDKIGDEQSDVQERENEAKLLGKKAYTGKYESPVAAYIDLETRLPVISRKGSEIRTYQFYPAPRTMLPLPSDIAAVIKQYEQRLKDYSRTPAHS